jgi:hypothetical protein
MFITASIDHSAYTKHHGRGEWSLPRGKQETTMTNNIREIAIDELSINELTMDQLDAVSGGDYLGTLIDRAVAIVQVATGTITSHATTLP